MSAEGAATGGGAQTQGTLPEFNRPQDDETYDRFPHLNKMLKTQKDEGLDPHHRESTSAQIGGDDFKILVLDRPDQLRIYLGPTPWTGLNQTDRNYAQDATNVLKIFNNRLIRKCVFAHILGVYAKLFDRTGDWESLDQKWRTRKHNGINKYYFMLEIVRTLLSTGDSELISKFGEIIKTFSSGATRGTKVPQLYPCELELYNELLEVAPEATEVLFGLFQPRDAASFEVSKPLIAEFIIKTFKMLNTKKDDMALTLESVDSLDGVYAFCTEFFGVARKPAWEGLWNDKVHPVQIMLWVLTSTYHSWYVDVVYSFNYPYAWRNKLAQCLYALSQWENVEIEISRYLAKYKAPHNPQSVVNMIHYYLDTTKVETPTPESFVSFFNLKCTRPSKPIAGPDPTLAHAPSEGPEPTPAPVATRAAPAAKSSSSAPTSTTSSTGSFPVLPTPPPTFSSSSSAPTSVPAPVHDPRVTHTTLPPPTGPIPPNLYVECSKDFRGHPQVILYSRNEEGEMATTSLGPFFKSDPEEMIGGKDDDFLRYEHLVLEKGRIYSSRTNGKTVIVVEGLTTFPSGAKQRISIELPIEL